MDTVDLEVVSLEDGSGLELIIEKSDVAVRNIN